MFRTLLAIALTAIAFLVVETAPAEACINSIERTKENAHKRRMARAERTQRAHNRRQALLGDSMASIDATARRLTGVKPSTAGWTELNKAIDDLNGDRNQKVIQRLYAEFGLDINQWALNPKVTSELQRDVVLVVALATLRSEGAYWRDHEADLAPKKVHEANLRWAVIAMDNVAFAGAVSQRHRAEAWARDPGLQRAALDKFRELAKKGKLESHHQYKAMARLEEKLGDQTRAQRALTKAHELRTN